MRTVFSVHFQKDLKKIIKKNPGYKKKITASIEKLMENPQHPSLRLQKLSGQHNWSISLDRSIRMIFRYEENTLYFTRIGTHDELYM
ncbi:MAG: type II toxin-antitoxin system mRNA interferase toxin, RelE/StbE family [Candidatus Pacebacteria bacterium]|nr:type II toxin-antitoxin system mRNA interferase toxin, RelE/StbE family [Candidatus Paceibacterota bacterium]